MTTIQGIRAVAFDAYGTLFDVASAAAAEQQALGARWQPLAQLWRTKQLEYTWLRGLAGRHADFARVTADALSFALEALGIHDDAIGERLLSLYQRLAAYPDAPAALRRLRRAGLRTAILSNGTPAMLATAAGSAGLTDLLDTIVSVEEVGVYKPHPSVYQRGVDRLQVPAHELLFVSANGWDAFSAKAFGLHVAWCNRTGQPAERLPETPDAEVTSLSEVAALVGA